jgi:hypothetical protein
VFRFHAMLFAICVSIVAANAAPSAVVDKRVSLSDLAGEFRALRAQQGHFSGGTWDNALDKWGGRKHKVMLALGEMLGDGTHARREIIALMGAPDQILVRGRVVFSQAYTGGDPRVRELLVYNWRGQHDFLFFASDGSTALASGWCAALE